MFGLRADCVRAFGRPNQTYPFGRVCAVEACRTRLSIYNESETCWIHEPVRYARVRGKKMERAS